jgi:hypothetical protein
VVGGSVMAAGDEHAPIREVALAVLVTVAVYWIVERWSVVLGSQVAGERLDRRRVVRVFADGFPMVQASYVPLIVMGVASGAGADSDLAVDIALGSVVALLLVFGAMAGRRAGITGWRLVATTIGTGALGAALIALKSVLD